jgi:hypothetical protein
MALEEKVSILPIIQENGHPIKGMLHFSESHLEAARTPHTADLALVSAVEATLQNEAKHIHSISLNIEVCIFKTFSFTASTDESE